MSQDQILLEYHDIIGDGFTKGAGRIYAMIFDPLTQQAVKFTGVIPYTLAAFTGVQGTFSYILPEDTNRKRHYKATLTASGTVYLPTVDYGDRYTVEYWAEAASGIQSRINDTFLGFDKLEWVSNRRSESRLSITQEQSIASKCAVSVWNYLQALADDIEGSMGRYIVNMPANIMAYYVAAASGTFEQVIVAIRNKANEILTLPAQTRYEAFCSVGYDTETERLTFTGWLEKNGDLQLDAKRMAATMYNSLNVAVASVTVTTILSNGQFVGFADGITLSPDEVYFIKNTMRDVNDVDHISGTSPVTWD